MKTKSIQFYLNAIIGKSKQLTSKAISSLKSVYAKLSHIPILGFTITLPQRIYKSFIIDKNVMPLFPEMTDIMPYLTKLRYENFKYKLGTLIGLMVAIIAVFVSSKDFNLKINRSYIAKIRINGEISSKTFGSKEFLGTLEKIGKDKKVVATIIEIDSPGGAASTSEILYNALKRLSQKKPTTAVVTGLAASGGYMAAMGCDKIISLESSMIGSIGVLSAGYQAVELLKKIGIKPEIYKSSKFKASPNRMELTDPQVAEWTQTGIMELFQWFSNLVKENRKLSDKEIKSVANGKVFTAKSALKLKLIDAIGDEYQLLEFWKKEGSVHKNIRVIEIVPPAPKQRNNSLSSRLIQSMAKILHVELDATLEDLTQIKSPQLLFQ